jgi:hypothetical protein
MSEGEMSREDLSGEEIFGEEMAREKLTMYHKKVKKNLENHFATKLI